MRLYASALAGWVSPADAFAQLYLDQPNSFWLDRETHPTEPFSIIGAGAAVDWVAAEELRFALTSRLDALAAIDVVSAGDLPFAWRPGSVTMVEYEGSAAVLDVDRALVFDHRTRQMYFVGLFADRDDFTHWEHAALLRLALVGGKLSGHLQAHRSATATSSTLRHAPDAYIDLIERAQQHIVAGDVYQLCLTNRLRIKTNKDAFAAFNELRALSPAPYASFMRLTRADGTVLEVASSSPEQFLAVDSTGRVSTKPIKGTRPRVRDAAGAIDSHADAVMAAQLSADTKERAENLMIVDLMRNDLLRVCEPNSIAVTSLFSVESYSTVHQLVSTVEGQLVAGATAVDALIAAFPGGSMTGAPKLRAIELIAELEDCPRGVYSGVIGWIGANGASDLGMTIRTMVFEGGEVEIGIGGGITSDSRAQAELEETRLKAAALLRVLGASDPWA